MIARLAEDSKRAAPTPFHQMLRTLDDRGRLLRVYSQNIDALEQKAGLTFGVPEPDVKRTKPRSTKGSTDTPAEIPIASDPSSSADAVSRLPTPPAETPRCIPLHGTLQNMHCQICLHSFPLEQYLGDLNEGILPICPDCSQVEENRQAIGKRSRGVGKLRPSVVLYNELHKDGEEVGEAVKRDLLGNPKGKGRTGADLLIVVGTSLRVPGTKRMVREFAKAIRSRSAASSTLWQNDPSSSTASSSQRSISEDEDTPIKTIYLNLDFPVPTREWEGVFDVWLRGDAQTFAHLVQGEIEREEKAKEAATERKRRREELKAEAAALQAAQMDEALRRDEVESKTKGKMKEPGKQAKTPSKAQANTTLGKRQAREGAPAPKSAKKSRLHLPKAVQPPPAHSKAKSGSKEKLVVTFPARLWTKVTSQDHIPPTSPRRKLKPESMLPNPGPSWSSDSSPDSSPLTSLASSPHPHAYSGFSSPLSEISPSSSPIPPRARSPAKRHVFSGIPITPDDSPDSTPPPHRHMSLSTVTASSHPSQPPMMRRRSSSYTTFPSSARPLSPQRTPSADDMLIDVESLDTSDTPQMAAAYNQPSRYPVSRPGLRPRLAARR